MSNKQTVVDSLNSAVSLSVISPELANDITERLDDIALAGCIGIDPESVDSEEITLVCVMLDASGSMETHKPELIKAYNDLFLKPIKGAKNADSIMISLWSFANQDVNLIHSYKPATQCNGISSSEYNPDGSTPLWKAVFYGMTGILEYGNRLISNGTRVKRIVLVISDGEENSSGKFVTSMQLKKFSQEMLSTETCILSYIFMGNDADGAKYAKEIGFPEKHRLTEDTQRGGDSVIRRIFGTLSSSVITASQSKISASGLGSNTFINP